MNINLLNSPINTYTSSVSESQSNPLLEATKTERDRSPLLGSQDKQTSLFNSFTNIQSGYFGLSPLAKYQYQNSNLSQTNSSKLRQIPGNPEETLKNAEEIIDKAVFSPLKNDPSRSDMLQAIQNKRIAQEQIANNGNLSLNLLG